MLVFSAITPHPPVLVPSVGKENLNKIKKTKSAMEDLADKFWNSKPEVVIVISPHGKLMKDAFVLNNSPEFKMNFKKFGDLESEFNFKGDVSFGYQIKEKLETKVNIRLIHNEELDHGASIPIFYLLKKCPDVKIITLGYSDKNNLEHFELGNELLEIIHETDKRIAVVASGDLSHCLNKKSPVKHSPVCKNFDKELIEKIENKNNLEIVEFDAKKIETASECGLKSIIILLGVLNDRNYNPEVLSYEGSLGVGYLVCNFDLNL